MKSTIFDTKKILFISHDANRSGAPFVLLYLLQWLKKNTQYLFDVLLLNDGPLREEFEKVAGKVYVVPQIINEQSLQNKIKRKLGFINTEEIKIKKIGTYLNVASYNFVYGNTIVSLAWLQTFKKLYNIKVLVAIHELKNSMEVFYTPEYLTINLSKLDLIVAGSEAVANDLISLYRVSPNLIKVAHAFIHTYVEPLANEQLLASTGIPTGRFIIGGAGTAEWRKGTDLIIPLCLYLKKHHPEFNFHLLWIGGNPKLQFVKNLLSDIEKAGLKDRVTILDNTSKYLDYINKFDVFAMLSREDPFPLVSLEAAYLQKPIVMFKGTGGTSELLVNGGGEIVAYADTEALGESIIGLSQSNTLREQMGKILKKEVQEKYSSEVACKKVLSIIESL